VENNQIAITAYNNNFERAWYKTEGMDFDGSDDAQSFSSIGLEKGTWSGYLGINYVDKICTQARCDEFESTEARTLFDPSAYYRLSYTIEIYTIIENLLDKEYISGRQPLVAY